MKLYFGLLVLLFFSSCERKKETIIVKPDHAIRESGIYYIGKLKLTVKEFKDATITFEMAGITNQKTYYQYGIGHAFSKFNTWFFYVDSKSNIWFYCADYSKLMVFVKTKTGSYEIGDPVKIPKPLYVRQNV